MAQLAPSSSLCDEVLITESDVDAAQQLIELSDEDKSSSIRGSKRSRSIRCWDNHEDGEQEVDQIQMPSDGGDIVMAKLQEIFGNDIVEVFPPKKQRRYRSLVNIYMATKPIDASGINTRVRA